jgi:hypothetical protein
MTCILHEDLHVFLSAKVIGLGISRLIWLLWLLLLHWLKVKDQILVAVPLLLCSLCVHFLTCFINLYCMGIGDLNPSIMGMLAGC